MCRRCSRRADPRRRPRHHPGDPLRLSRQKGPGRGCHRKRQTLPARPARAVHQLSEDRVLRHQQSAAGSSIRPRTSGTLAARTTGPPAPTADHRTRTSAAAALYHPPARYLERSWLRRDNDMSSSLDEVQSNSSAAPGRCTRSRPRRHRAGHHRSGAGARPRRAGQSARGRADVFGQPELRRGRTPAVTPNRRRGERATSTSPSRPQRLPDRFQRQRNRGGDSKRLEAVRSSPLLAARVVGSRVGRRRQDQQRRRHRMCPGAAPGRRQRRRHPDRPARRALTEPSTTTGR